MSKVRKSAAFAAVVCAFVGGWEGLQLVAYRDPINIPTICYGETKNVRMGMKATKAECDAMLIESLIEHEDGMLRCLKREVPDGAHLAFLSLTYNVGVGNFCRSTLVKKANAGDIKGACEELMKWNRAGGVVFRGLTNRRKAEREICLRGIE